MIWELYKGSSRTAQAWQLMPTAPGRKDGLPKPAEGEQVVLTTQGCSFIPDEDGQLTFEGSLHGHVVDLPEGAQESYEEWADGH